MIFNKKDKKTDIERLEERREKILARGNKFRYPIQFSKVNIILSTVIIGVMAVLAVFAVLAINLYHGQNTGDMMFRLTKVLPIPVALVDGEKVRFSDYLLIYRSSLTPIEKHGGHIGEQKDAEAMRTYYKRFALSEAEKLTYAKKIAKEAGVSVTEDEINKEWEKQRLVGGVKRSEASFLRVLKENFGLEREEYLRIVEMNLLKSKVMEKIDKRAEEIVLKLEKNLSEKAGDMKAVADVMKDDVIYEETGGLVSKANVDGGRAAVASELNVGQLSGKFLSTNGDGYYFVKLIEKTEKEVNYASIKIVFNEFEKRMNDIKNREDGIVEYIKL